MDYRIIRATSETGQIEVMYTHENEDIAAYSIDVPIVDGAFITGEALDSEIRFRAPTWLIKRNQELKQAEGFEHIEALVQNGVSSNTSTTDGNVNLDSDSANNAAMWMQVQFEKQVAKALVKFGVLESDPTEVPVTKL